MKKTLFVGGPGGDPVPLPLDELLIHHASVRDATARSLHIEHDVDSDLSILVAMQSFVYAFNAYKALGLLLPELYHESAAVVLRQLWEVSLNLHWIECSPCDRAQDFCNFTVMEYRKLMQKSGDTSPLQDFDAATSRFQERFRYQDGKGRNQRHSDFATKNIHDRAVELGDPWKKEYDLVYHLASMHAHGAPGAILHSYFQQTYPSPDIRERNSASLIAILSTQVLVRDLHVLVRMNIIPDSDETDRAFSEFQNTVSGLPNIAK